MRSNTLLIVSFFLACDTTGADPFSKNGPTGTGGTAATTAPPAGADLIGTWYYADSSAAIGATFDGTNYVLNLVTSLVNGSIVVQSATGTYTVSGNSVVLHKLKSSCQGIKPQSNAQAITYGRSGTALTLNLDGVHVMILQPAGSPTGTAAFTIGCIKDDNTFVANPLTPLP